jgi:Leucine-rich repeat (LRR) protein
MKNSILMKKAIVLALMIGGVFSSCKKDDPAVEPVEKLPSVEVTNAQLKAALVRKGFPFDEQGLLVKSDSVLNITTLDISACELDDASGLEIFPKLEEVNLADNKFFYKFDFSVLPASVTRVNLRGNEIYEFPGLLTVVVEENDDETVTLLRPLTKIHLPYSARYNCKEVVYLYEQLKTKIESGEAEIKIDNADNQLTAYNTLREVPNDITRARLKTLYPSFFEGDYINIAKRVFNTTEVTKTMSFSITNTPSVDGAQYILHHRDFRGATVGLTVYTGDEYTVMPYLKIPSHVNYIILEHVDTPNDIDFSEAENVTRIVIYNNRTLQTLDLRGAKIFAQREASVEFRGSNAGMFYVEACASLKEIVYHEAVHWGNNIQFYDLPALERVDLSKFEAIKYLKLAFLPGTIVYPEPKKWINGTAASVELMFDDEKGSMTFGIRKDIAYRDATKNFIRTYIDHLIGMSVTPASSRIEYDRNSEETEYNWSFDNDLLDNL